MLVTAHHQHPLSAKNQKQFVVQLPPVQQVVQVTIRPLDMIVCVEQAAHVAVAAAANAIAMIAFFMMSP